MSCEYDYNDQSDGMAPPPVRRQKAYCKTTDLRRKSTQTESIDQIFADYKHKNECDNIVELIQCDSATSAEKHALYDKLCVCTCCWRHLHMRPDKCAKDHELIPAIVQSWHAVECHCLCRHMMRLIARNM